MESLTIGRERWVHLDLKGAPLKLQFYEKFFPFIKDIGATGVLMEWEDTFPYTRDLLPIGGLSSGAQASGAPYNIEEAKQIICMAEDCGLAVVPLVQTMGHMEFVLKHERWRGLREIDAYPSSICPSNGGTMALVVALVEQVLALHPNSRYIHIGADEVWHMGVCPACVKRAQNNKHGKAALYLDHVTEVAQYIKDNYPSLKIIIWDDMLRNIDLSILQDYYLGTLVEPMVWHYNSTESFKLGPEMWDKYGSIFVNVWGATAFKGSTGSCQTLPINRYHVGNHESWLSELSRNANKIINFRGIALTGWSRYDHYATLCELLPCAIPSLALCMKTWLNGGYNAELHRSVGKMLGYADSDSVLHMDVPPRPTLIPPQLHFPGWQILLGIEWLANIKAQYKSITESDQMATWFNQWQVLNNYTNPMQIESILPVLSRLYTDINSLETYIKTNFEPYLYQHTLDELVGTLVTPMKQHVRQLRCECETQIENGCRIRGQKQLIL